MKKEFILPDLGENIALADVLKVVVNAGDKIEIDSPVIEIETDKATIEVPSTVNGKVVEVFVKEGEKIKIGAAIFTYEESVDASVDSTPKIIEPIIETKIERKEIAAISLPETPKQSEAAATSHEFHLPDLGENISSADILKLHVKVGDAINIDDVVLEIETDKATIEVPSNISGVVSEVFVKEGEKAKVGSLIFKIKDSTAPQAIPSVQHEDKKSVEPKIEKIETEQPMVYRAPAMDSLRSATLGMDSHQPPLSDNPAPAAPSVRRLAREIGIDVNKVPGSGPHGRISIDDVKKFAKKINEQRGSAPSGTFVAQQSLPDFSKFGATERTAMSNVRAKTAEHLSYAWATIPHVTQFDKANISELEKTRKIFSPKAEEKGAKLTVTAILLKIIASALKNFPQFNSSVDMNSKEIVYKKYFNVGVAVDTDRGLIVPVIRDVDKKNILELSVELAQISAKARSRKISPEDLQGGCFTISNLGGIGGTYFTPIVNSPEVAILGVSKGAMEPVYQNGNFVPQLMMPLSLSYDHRVIDGADGIRFLRWVIEALEQPMKLLVEG